MNKNHSQKYFDRAEKVMVGGVNSPVRSFKGVDSQPIVMKYGKKQHLFDYDGNKYTDYCLSWGAAILGHANRNVVLASKVNTEKGLSFGTTTRQEIEIAEHIVEAVPSIDKIRFVNSGTEATMSATRLARGFTGCSKVIKFDGCYHGHFDDFLIKAGSGVAQLSESSSLGIPTDHVGNTISLPYNDCESFTQVMDKHHQDIACVILEPVTGNMGVIVPDKVFLQTLRDVTKQYGIVLIFDEIMTGFRSSQQCVQGDFGIIPDMTCLGKIIGSGFPIGAYGGKKEIMDCLAPLGGVYQAGTFSGNPVVMRAGLAGLRYLNDEMYDKVKTLGSTFVSEMNHFFAENDVQAHFVGYGSQISLRFRSAQKPVKNYDQAIEASGGERYVNLFKHLLKNGIYFPPADLEAFFISTVHTKKDLQFLAQTTKDFFLSEKSE